MGYLQLVCGAEHEAGTHLPLTHELQCDNKGHLKLFAWKVPAINTEKTSTLHPDALQNNRWPIHIAQMRILP